MVRRNINIGTRAFVIAGVTLGTARRVPGALKTATDVVRRQGTEGDETKTLAPAPNEMNAMIELIHDGIVVAMKSSGETPPTLDELITMFDEQGITEGLTQMYRAVGSMFEQDSSPEPDTGKPSGNSHSSESAN